MLLDAVHNDKCYLISQILKLPCELFLSAEFARFIQDAFLELKAVMFVTEMGLGRAADNEKLDWKQKEFTDEKGTLCMFLCCLIK